MQHDLISTRYKLQIMRGRGIQNGKINWFVLNLMDKEILQLAMTQIDEKLPKQEQRELDSSLFCAWKLI